MHVLAVRLSDIFLAMVATTYDQVRGQMADNLKEIVQYRAYAVPPIDFYRGTPTIKINCRKVTEHVQNTVAAVEGRRRSHTFLDGRITVVRPFTGGLCMIAVDRGTIQS